MIMHFVLLSMAGWEEKKGVLKNFKAEVQELLEFGTICSINYAPLRCFSFRLVYFAYKHSDSSYEIFSRNSTQKTARYSLLWIMGDWHLLRLKGHSLWAAASATGWRVVTTRRSRWPISGGSRAHPTSHLCYESYNIHSLQFYFELFIELYAVLKNC